MIEDNLYLQKYLEDYVEYLENVNSRSLPLLDFIVDLSFSFQDPYYNVKGVDDAKKILYYRFKMYPNSHYKVIDFVWGRKDSVAYIYWNFFYQPPKICKPLILEAISEVKFLPNGKIYSCSEFWGEHSNFNIKAYKNKKRALAK